MPAGPSEVAVFADATANPAFVAADLLSQAEHGVDSQVLLFTDTTQLAEAVAAEVSRQLAELPRAAIAAAAIANSRVFVLDSLEQAMKMTNAYAPEHLILAAENAIYWADKVLHAGSVFIGHYTPESVGDYASGTNHTLPTYGYARQYSGVSTDSFVRKITYQQLTENGLQQLGPQVQLMAEAEELSGHARAVTERLKTL
jgi:histidinol dehydrogenase